MAQGGTNGFCIILLGTAGACRNTMKCRSILYADDDPQARAALCMLLHDEGHRVITVDSVSQARTELEINQFDLVICDGTLDPNRAHDGVYWANLVARNGQKVLVLSADEYARQIAQQFQLPFLDKLEMRQKLHSTLNSLLS